jgi:retron-type reverse transcriptase
LHEVLRRDWRLPVCAAVLTPIYEAEFLGFSYGFRPGRGQHDGLDALGFGLGKRRINWVLDADIRSFLDRASYCHPSYES